MPLTKKIDSFRGVPHQPGLVCTVLSDEELTELGLRSENDPPSVTHGVAYLIPDDQVQSGKLAIGPFLLQAIINSRTHSDQR